MRNYIHDWVLYAGTNQVFVVSAAIDSMRLALRTNDGKASSSSRRWTAFPPRTPFSILPYSLRKAIDFAVKTREFMRRIELIKKKN